MANLSKIISNLLVLISTLFLIYIFYRSEIYHNGLNAQYYYKYYIIDFFLFVISFASYIMPKNLKINLFMILFSIFFGLYIFEGYLNLKYKKFSIYKKNTNKEYDTREQIEIYQDLKKINSKIVVTPHPIYFTDRYTISPLSGIANRETLHCNENGYYSIYESDRYGFNNPDSEWNKDIIEFLLVGDSFTRGDCVNEPNTISGNIKKLIINKNGVLNLGFSGNGPLRTYATLKEYLHLKDVKKVLWIYFEGNDLQELNLEKKHKILNKYLDNKNFSQNLVFKKDAVQKLLLSELDNIEKNLNLHFTEVKKLKRNSITSFLILTKMRELFLESFLFDRRIKNDIFLHKEFKQTLKMADQLTREYNSQLYFVYLPSFSRFQLFNNNDKYMHYQKVLNIIKDLKIPIIDINKDLFNNIKNPLILFPFKAPGHYNEKGYELVANKIFSEINKLDN